MATEEETYRAYVKEKLDTIDDKVTYTNGKVRKIIIAIFILGGFCIGLGISQPQLFALLLSIL